MKIGLISDIHATPQPVAEAFELFRQHNVDLSICCGDIAGYGQELDETVELLLASDCQVISGNHDIWFLDEVVPGHRQWIQDYFAGLPEILDFTAADKRIYVVHAQPPRSNSGGIKLLDEQGEMIPGRKESWASKLQDFNHDVLIVGHTHQVFSEWLGNTLVINPGSTCFNHSCAILTLPELDVQFLALSGKEIQKNWNWSQVNTM